MSTGAPKEYFNPTAVRDFGGLAVRGSTDICKGCRRCIQSLIKTVAGNRISTGIIISLPMIAITCFLIYMETALTTYILQLTPSFNYYKSILYSPVYTLVAITYGFGILAMVCVRCELQNGLRFCAFVYRGIAHWILLTVFLLFIPIAGYLPLGLIFQIALWSLIPAFLWLFTASTMSTHSDLISQAIEAKVTAMNSIDVAMV